MIVSCELNGPIRGRRPPQTTMTIQDRFLTEWKKNFEEGTLPVLKILQPSEDVDGDGVASLSVTDDACHLPILNTLQEDLEYTHELIFKIRNELKKAKFCQSWLQTEFTRCRKRSESVTPTETPNASDDDLESQDTADEVEEEVNDGGRSEDVEDSDSDGEEPLYMNPRDIMPGGGGRGEVAEDSDSDHDYEYLYDNAPFMNNNTTRMPPGAATSGATGIDSTSRRSSSPPVKPRRPAPAVPIRHGSLNGNASSVVRNEGSPDASPPMSPGSLSRTFSIDNPNATTTERLCRPTMGIIPSGVSVMPLAYLEEAQRKRYSARFDNMSPLDEKTDDGRYFTFLTYIIMIIKSCSYTTGL